MRDLFMHGQLQPAITDDVFTYISIDADVEGGSVQWYRWFCLMNITHDQFAEAVSATGNPRASEAGRLVPGWHIITQNDDGIVWVFRYPGPNLARREFDEANEEYGRWLESMETTP